MADIHTEGRHYVDDREEVTLAGSTVTICHRHHQRDLDHEIVALDGGRDCGSAGTDGGGAGDTGSAKEEPPWW